MRSFWFDPYLWVHLAGIAAVPLLLELCLLGLAIGEPLFPVWFELLFVGTIGILPILWMQWQRPFSIFSLVLLALKPSQLTEDQRRILQRFKLPIHRVLTILSAVAMVWVLWQLYQIAPAVAPGLFPGFSRGAALLVAAIGFLGSHLFLQVPVSVLSVLLASDSAFAATPAYPRERITQDFTIPGIRVAKILPPLIRPVVPIAAQVPPDPTTLPITKPVSAASAPSPESPPTQAMTVEPPLAAADYEPEPEIQEAKELEQEPKQEFGDRDDQFDEAEAEIKEIIAEEAEIAETIATETVTIDRVATQTRDAVAVGDLENEAIEAITSDPSLDLAPGQPSSPETQSWQLDESGEVMEEIKMLPEQPGTVESESTNSAFISPESDDSEEDSGSGAARQLEMNSEIGSSSAEIAVDAIDPQSSQSVEIVEDSAIVETLDGATETLARETSEPEQAQTDRSQSEARSADLSAENLNQEHPN